jgi:fused signal recognition particle receptor
MFSYLKEKFASGINKIKEVIGFGNEINTEEIEKVLLNQNFSTHFIKKFTEKIKKSNFENNTSWQEMFTEELQSIFNFPPQNQESADVIILIGINGSGKTTSAIKLSKIHKKNNKTLLVPADTFRAAAKDQLAELAKEFGVDCFDHDELNTSTVIFKAAEFAKIHEYKKIIIDTAGRIHQNDSLLRELKKNMQTAEKVFPEKTIKRLLVLDGLQGKTLFEQAKMFLETTKIEGLIITKLDANIKPGIICSIVEELQLPIWYLSMGQKDTELIPFEKKDFIALFHSDQP